DVSVFCFDGGCDYRKSVYPGYKENRKDANEQPEKKAAREFLYQEVSNLRTVTLPSMGAVNVFWERGFEADDLIASCVKNLDTAKKVYLVSTDEDLYQLIEGNRVVIYKPGKNAVYSEDDYRNEFYDTPPCLYASAKAWAGCSSDGIPGLPKVGMKTACRFVNGHTKSQETWFDHLDIYNRNIKLVKLPAPGTPKCVPQMQQFPIQWDKTIERIEKVAAPRGVKQ
ncbi:hypothetical protein EBR03_08730, partial [bacterium]|nr:hypothetical protein [bacterium]